jgi:hypothetical protein
MFVGLLASAGLLFLSCEQPPAIKGLSQGEALQKGDGPDGGTGVISGFVINDLNCNGDLNEGEPGIAGVTVTLKSGSCPGGGVVATTTTGSGGEYSFSDLAFGDYCVSATVTTGCTASTENPAPAKLDVGHPGVKLDFGFCCKPPGTPCTPGFWKNHTELWFNVGCGADGCPDYPRGGGCAQILSDLQAKGPGGETLRNGAAAYLDARCGRQCN